MVHKGGIAHDSVEGLKMKLSAPVYHLKHKAKQLARARHMPLHAALDYIAQQEGATSWSLLSAQYERPSPQDQLMHAVRSGALLLLAARPQRGKTILALEVAIKHALSKKPAYFFTLDYHLGQVADRLAKFGVLPENVPDLTIDTSDEICAHHIIQHVSEARQDVLCVVDYLQILDQRRQHPPVQAQVQKLKSFAQRSGSCFLFLSQIDRQFEPSGRDCPNRADIRLPNPLDLTLFDKIYGLHNDQLYLMPTR